MKESDNIQVQLLPLSTSYEQAMREQQAAYDAVFKQLATSGTAQQAYLFIGEHAPVYTLGLHGKQANLLVKEGQQGVPSLYHTNRGGDITYHGPGQLVVYFIAHLPSLKLGARKYVECLQRAVIETLVEFQIDATVLEDAPGVWLLPTSARPLRKICALGIHINRGITTHGIALNVQPQMSYFAQINPCGFTDRGVTSMMQELTHPIDIVLVKKSLLLHLAHELHFSCTANDGAITKP